LLEAPALDDASAFQVGHEAVLQQPEQLVDRLEAATDQLTSGLPNETQHPGVSAIVGLAFDEDQPLDATCGGTIELALGGRKAFRPLGAVLPAEESEVDRGPVDLLEVDVVGTPVTRRKLLEQEDVEEPSQEWVRSHVVGDRRALGGQFLLDAADEDQLAHRVKEAGLVAGLDAPGSYQMLPTRSMSWSLASARDWACTAVRC
jgi:hypothetical protein